MRFLKILLINVGTHKLVGRYTPTYMRLFLSVVAHLHSPYTVEFKVHRNKKLLVMTGFVHKRINMTRSDVGHSAFPGNSKILNISTCITLNNALLLFVVYRITPLPISYEENFPWSSFRIYWQFPSKTYGRNPLKISTQKHNKTKQSKQNDVYLLQGTFGLQLIQEIMSLSFGSVDVVIVMKKSDDYGEHSSIYGIYYVDATKQWKMADRWLQSSSALTDIVSHDLQLYPRQLRKCALLAVPYQQYHFPFNLYIWLKRKVFVKTDFCSYKP